MYDRLKSISLKASASALDNNLAARFDVDGRKKLSEFAVVHKSIVNVVTASASRVTDIRRYGVGGGGAAAAAAESSGSGGAEEDGETRQQQILVKDPAAGEATPSSIMQCRWVSVGGRLFLVAAASAGIQMFETKGQVVVFWHPLKKADGVETKSCFARGIASLGDRFVCVGTSDGEILCFEMPSSGSEIKLVQSLQGHASAVSALASSDSTLVSCDDNGDLIVWNLTKEHSIVHKKRVKDVGSVTSMVIHRDRLVAANGTGHIRLYSLPSVGLICEVTAHARWITALDLAPESQLLLSTSEDCFVRVWRLNASSSIPIEHVFCHKVSDVPLVGGRFCDPSGQSFALTGYDHKTIYLFSS